METTTLVDIAEFIVSEPVNGSQLVIPPRSLPYGLFQLRFISRMWDTNDWDPHQTRLLPFEGYDSTYVRVLASPLVALLTEDSVDFVTRGRDQVLTLEPYLFSFDPDEPELKVKHSSLSSLHFVLRANL